MVKGKHVLRDNYSAEKIVFSQSNCSNVVCKSIVVTKRWVISD